jgi:hypothetical protein
LTNGKFSHLFCEAGSIVAWPAGKQETCPLDDVLRFNAISLPNRDAVRSPYGCELQSTHAELAQVILTWENHDQIVELFRRASGVALQITDLWEKTKGSRLEQDDVDFLAGLMAVQAQLAKAVSQVD